MSTQPQDPSASETKGVDSIKLNSKAYSVDMIETMFADSLSRGMQNAIISQQNAQMASSASITNACARILQARSDASTTDATPPANAEVKIPKDDDTGKTSTTEINDGNTQSSHTITAEKRTPPKKSHLFAHLAKHKALWLCVVVGAIALLFVLLGYLGGSLTAANHATRTYAKEKTGDIIMNQAFPEVSANKAKD